MWHKRILVFWLKIKRAQTNELKQIQVRLTDLIQTFIKHSSYSYF
jgi:hypothetical protein